MKSCKLFMSLLISISVFMPSVHAKEIEHNVKLKADLYERERVIHEQMHMDVESDAKGIIYCDNSPDGLHWMISTANVTVFYSNGKQRANNYGYFKCSGCGYGIVMEGYPNGVIGNYLTQFDYYEGSMGFGQVVSDQSWRYESSGNLPGCLWYYARSAFELRNPETLLN